MLSPSKTMCASPRGGTKPRPGRSATRWGPAGTGAVALLLAVLVLFPLGCAGPSANEQPNAEPEPAQETTQAGAATLDEVLDSPSDYYGQTATLSGEVTQTLTPQTFEIGGESNDPEPGPGYGESADGLLVVANLDEVSDAPDIALGDTVRVTGTIRSFDVREIEDELGTDLRGNVLTYYASQASLVATSIEAAGGGTTAR